MKQTIRIFFCFGIVMLCLEQITAQSRIDLPYYYCALNGTCFNQPPSWAVRIENEEYSPEQAYTQTIMFMNAHPGYNIVEPANNLYNCHGFAYSVYQGGEKLIIEWNNDLCSYNGSGSESYIQVPASSVQSGDIATLIDPNDNGTYSPHSAIVISADSLLSKWGLGPLTKHHKDSVINIPSYYTGDCFTFITVVSLTTK